MSNGNQFVQVAKDYKDAQVVANTNLANSIATTASGYMKTTRNYVKENPAKGMAIAIVAGAVAGSLLTLMMRKRS